MKGKQIKEIDWGGVDPKTAFDWSPTENWLFAKFSAAMMDPTRMQNDKYLKVLSAQIHPVLDQNEIAKLQKLNDTGDHENSTMVAQIIKTRYGKYLEVQQKGVH